MSDRRSRARAIFMDRDGTVSEEVGYMYHAGLYKPFPWAGEAIRRINESGIKAILVTNQSGIERGYFKEQGLDAEMVFFDSAEPMAMCMSRYL